VEALFSFSSGSGRAGNRMMKATIIQRLQFEVPGTSWFAGFFGKSASWFLKPSLLREGRCRRTLIACAVISMLFISSAGFAQLLPLKMQLLVISANDTDPSYQAVAAFLDYVGVPYTSLIATKQTLTPDMLSDSAGGKYQGIILATDSLSYEEGGIFQSVFDSSEWRTLWAYEAAYQVRQVTYFTFPNSQFGLSAPVAISTESAPLYLHLTSAGRQIFSYLKADARIPVRNAYTYLARPLDAATTSLLDDEAGNALLSIRTYADGRENLAVTCNNRRNLLHSQLLSYGIIDWVTRGIHLNERTVYLIPQVDDIFLKNWLFDTQSGAPSQNLVYRLNDQDMVAVEKWQDSVRRLRNPSLENFTITMVFNGGGVSGSSDVLAQYFTNRQDLYHWINHTYKHPDLNTIGYANALQEIRLNHEFALAFPLHQYRLENLVTGAITGLNNPEALKAMADFGIKYIVSDASIPEQSNPRPNIGIYNAHQPSILQIPRHPTAIYTTTSTIEEELGQYNALYRKYWGKDLSYQEIMDKESDQVLSYMLSYDMDPLMFHQINLRAYDGQHSLLGDMLDAAIFKYSQLMNLPILSPPQDVLGTRMAQRMAMQSAGVEAELMPGSGLWLRANQSVVVAISGITIGNPSGWDTCLAGTYRDYNGKPTSWVQVEAGNWQWISLTGKPDEKLPPIPSPSARKTQRRK
jgi:hypothetical protein